MSRRFSFTTIFRVETMLNAATRRSAGRGPGTVPGLLQLERREEFRFGPRSRAAPGTVGPSSAFEGLAQARGLVEVAQPGLDAGDARPSRRTPRVVERHVGQRVSYSYMPDDEHARPRRRPRIRGIAPVGRGGAEAGRGRHALADVVGQLAASSLPMDNPAGGWLRGRRATRRSCTRSTSGRVALQRRDRCPARQPRSAPPARRASPGRRRRRRRRSRASSASILATIASRVAEPAGRSCGRDVRIQAEDLAAGPPEARHDREDDDHRRHPDA